MRDAFFLAPLRGEQKRKRNEEAHFSLPQMSRSREGHVFISSVNLSTEGNYRCEASAEAPSFQTVVQEKEVKVFGECKDPASGFFFNSKTENSN